VTTKRTPTKRAAIPKTVEIAVWNLHICDNKAVARGGTNNISNLLPISGDCNKAMQTRSIEWYKAQYFGLAKAHPAAPSRRTSKVSITKTSATKSSAVKAPAKCPN
jgi:hypothetical protein